MAYSDYYPAPPLETDDDQRRLAERLARPTNGFINGIAEIALAGVTVGQTPPAALELPPDSTCEHSLPKDQFIAGLAHSALLTTSSDFDLHRALAALPEAA